MEQTVDDSRLNEALRGRNTETGSSTAKTELAALREENAALKARLAQLPRSSKDFAAAVRRALDELDTELAQTTNPTGQFAVRSFRLESNVHVELTELGDMTYRFPGFDEKPDPSTLTRVTLDIVPLPKQTLKGTFTLEQFKPGAGIDEIEGLSATQQKLLRQNRIDTLGDFLAVGTAARTKLELSALLRVDRDELARLLASAELLTLQGVDSGRSRVLIAAGFDGLRALTVVTPEALVRRFNKARAALGRKDVELLRSAEAALWIRAAAAFLGVKQAASDKRGGKSLAAPPGHSVAPPAGSSEAT